MSESTDQHVRPTKRGMDDLGIEMPEIDAPLHAIDQADIRGVQAIPKQLEAGGAKRLVGLKDRVWFKYKFDATFAGIRPGIFRSPAARNEKVISSILIGGSTYTRRSPRLSRPLGSD